MITRKLLLLASGVKRTVEIEGELSRVQSFEYTLLACGASKPDLNSGIPRIYILPRQKDLDVVERYWKDLIHTPNK